MLIRREAPGDGAVIRSVTAAAFARLGEAEPAEAPLVDWLRAGPAWLVALLGSASYYPRFGFRLAREYQVAPPQPDWAPHFQVRTLTAYDPAVRGVFAYPEPFGRL